MLDIQKLNIVLFTIEIILHSEVTLGVFSVELFLIIKIILQSDHLKNYKGTVQISGKIIEDFFGGEK